MNTRDTAIENSLNWWVCDNIVHPQQDGQMGLLYMGFPRVFLLLRNGDDYYADYDDFKNKLVEVNFLSPEDRVGGKELEKILIDAYNFIVLYDEEEENRYNSGIYNDDLL